MQMITLVLAPFALLTLAAAGYAQYRLPLYTRTRLRGVLAQAMLVLTGIAFGLVTAIAYGSVAPPPLVFLAGFGLVHVPAAIILALKRRRQQ